MTVRRRRRSAPRDVARRAEGRPARPVVTPGPGDVRIPVLRTLDLRVRRRIAGLLPGDFRSAMLGQATELAQVRGYQPGDDVRAIDWKVTARTGEPHVRLHVAERALTTWIVLDRTASMRFGTQDRTKSDVAEGLVLAISHLATIGADRLGVIELGERGPRVALPPSGDHRMILRYLHEARTRRTDAVDAPTGRAASLSATLDLANRICRRPGAVVVVSDLRGPQGWKPPMARLALRHHVLVLEVIDEREQRLTDAGELVLFDPESGRQLRVDTSDRRLRERFAIAADAERDGVRRLVASTGADHVVVTTSGDWLRPVAAFLSKRRRAL
ncbi:MAG TPA: DUF58 domain-containing protein [Actinomycetota bacterium]|nr:DUF58 domain-containing protein [Actinomycetota bacterium]